MVKWNLGKLGESLNPLVSPEDAAVAIEAFDGIYQEAYLGTYLTLLR